MTELDRLIAERNELNKKIHALQMETVRCGSARLSLNPSNRKTWRLMVNIPYIYEKNKSSWVSVIEEWEKEDVIKQIPALIADLSNVYNVAKEEDDEQGI